MARRKKKRTRETTVKKTPKKNKRPKTDPGHKHTTSKERPKGKEKKETKKKCNSKENAKGKERKEMKKNSDEKEGQKRGYKIDTKKKPDLKEKPERNVNKVTKKNSDSKERLAQGEKKETKKKLYSKERPERKEKKDIKRNSDSKERPEHGANKVTKKDLDSKERLERSEKKKTVASSGEYSERVKELLQDGILILIDRANLEKSNEQRMEEKRDVNKKKTEAKKAEQKTDGRLKCTINYDELIDVIARNNPGSKHATKPRKVLKAFVVTTEPRKITGMNTRNRDGKNVIEMLVPPVPNSATGKEKGVDCMIVRKIVEEYASLEMVRLQGKRIPKRTFCLVSADSDFVDVAKAAADKGFDVEVWPFLDHSSYSKKKWENAYKCDSGRCGRFTANDLGEHQTKISSCKPKVIRSPYKLCRPAHTATSSSPPLYTHGNPASIE